MSLHGPKSSLIAIVFRHAGQVHGPASRDELSDGHAKKGSSSRLPWVVREPDLHVLFACTLKRAWHAAETGGLARTCGVIIRRIKLGGGAAGTCYIGVWYLPPYHTLPYLTYLTLPTLLLTSACRALGSQSCQLSLIRGHQC